MSLNNVPRRITVVDCVGAVMLGSQSKPDLASFGKLTTYCKLLTAIVTSTYLLTSPPPYLLTALHQ